MNVVMIEVIVGMDVVVLLCVCVCVDGLVMEVVL